MNKIQELEAKKQELIDHSESTIDRIAELDKELEELKAEDQEK